MTLTAGTHTVTLARTASDSGNVNLDSLALVTPGAAYPGPPAPQSQPCAFGTCVRPNPARSPAVPPLANDHNDYAGAGFVGRAQPRRQRHDRT